MGLDCLPRPCGDLLHRHTVRAPEGLVHEPGQPCPLQPENYPIGIFGTCCSLRGKAAAYELDAIGEIDLANAMYADMTCEEAIAFAQRLRSTADRLERDYSDAEDKPQGFSWNDLRRNAETGKLETIKCPTPFDEVLTIVREAASWYEKIGQLGFGVHAWY